MNDNTLVDSLLAAMEDSPAPIYQRVKGAIINKVTNQEWLPNQRVPSEAELVNALGVSRMTINRALRELTAEGFLKRQQGVGTFVAPQRVHSALFEVHNIADDIATRGNKHHAQVLRLDSGQATTDEAMQLGVRTGHNVFRSLLVHFENDKPVQMEERVVNADIAPAYGEQDFTTITPYTYLNQTAPISEGEHLVEAVLPSRWEAQALALPDTAACLQIRRRTWSNKHIVTSARLLSPGDVLQLFGHFQR
ncbi:MAG: histidine utilization repressor [Gammaproteobacteria bacterium]|jgi:GntR family histidine utilization transcriptional repressor|nr:histidine utilization repressor [Gammaproteobacteria bacterium]MCP4879666.1 histidine utilization repressor [Gammaproteobacteria bacterium]MDP6164651.1 histidine utilization repressor [Gammaproteobacteria bacterium]